MFVGDRGAGAAVSPISLSCTPIVTGRFIAEISQFVSRLLDWDLERLEPDEGKLSSPVLRGGAASNGFPLPDFSKAKLFSDEKSAARILATRDPMTQKMIGRKVAGFDQQIWEAKRESIVFVGCREKFAQNPGLRSILLATAPTELVEASPYDLIWGIGLGERDPRLTDRSQWRGQNLLGITLMRVRDALAMN
ncbi:NADAR family protein [Paraburkholderia kirstenboschensis]|uniref:NADAR family protein n=1 Tax=Paraburkholderia kirstenboschensis TaxID=1245436 RepID=UPI0022A88EB0|nr:NADAR family protein [Paraburkholderia kirstenboschensis]